MRIVYNENGQGFSAELPARDKRGLKQEVIYLGRIDEHSMKVEDISESSFYNTCRLLWDRRNLPA